MTTLKETIAKNQADDKSARSINREGMHCARQNQAQLALQKFREAARLMPRNPDYKLNAVQIILTDDSMQTDAKLLQEAREYLDSISLENTGARWRLFKKMKAMLSDE